MTVVHYDSDLELGKFGMSFGGRTRNNEALKICAAALKEEGFGGFCRVLRQPARTCGLGVAGIDGRVEVLITDQIGCH